MTDTASATVVAGARLAAYDVEADLATIDAGYLDARASGPTPDLVEAATRVGGLVPGPDWGDDLGQTKIAYFRNAPDPDTALRNYDPQLIDVAVRFDYVRWPRRIQDHVKGRTVLDVGCGFGGFGMGFLVAGAASYAGIDPDMDLDSTRARDKRTRRWADMGVTPRQIAEVIPAIRLFQSRVEDHAFDEKFDTIALHNVTEHLHNLDQVLSGLAAQCHADTELVLLHHNFYSWNGHHQAPVQPAQLEETDPEHQRVYDWRHINAAPTLPETHEILTTLSRIRLDDLRAALERHFDVVQWDEILSNDATRARLTPEIVERVREAVPDITERELTVNTVLCVGRPKS